MDSGSALLAVAAIAVVCAAIYVVTRQSTGSNTVSTSSFSDSDVIKLAAALAPVVDAMRKTSATPAATATITQSVG